MQLDNTIARLAALSARPRLDVLRLLVKHGGEKGMHIAEIARRLDVPLGNLPTHLLHLSNAGLVRSRREGRNVVYSVTFESVEETIQFLADECAGGRVIVAVKNPVI